MKVSPVQSLVTHHNAFEIMKNAQKSLQVANDGLPFPEKVRDRKDRLFNDLIILLREMNVRWSDPGAHGTPFLKILCEVLWYIVGHHDTIGEKSKIFS